jgi:hypothetical protein
MSTHVDHKGKYFTDVINKELVHAIIQTLTVRVEGDIYVRPGERLKDELNRTDKFIAVTDAVVFNARGEVLYKSSFMSVNLDQVIWVSPKNDEFH